jgi:polyisoprenoid-binding protein YceI
MKFLRLSIFILAIVLILAFGAVSVGHLRRNSALSKRAEPGPMSLSTAPSNKGRIDTQRYRLDSSQSKFIARALAGGLLWFKGHDHLVAVREFTGEAQLTPAAITPASLQITAKADSMVETSSVFTEPQKQIINKELREIVLEPSKYPDIIFRSTNVTGKSTGNDQYSLSITGDLTLHGVTRQITIPTKVSVTGNDLRAIGEFSIDRGDFKVKATSAVHGLVRVRDKVKFTFDIVGHQF